MFLEFIEKDPFYEYYINYFADKFIYNIEKMEETATEEERKQRMENIQKALKLLIEKNNRLDIPTIIKVGNMVNKNERVPEGFRKIDVTAGKNAKFTPVSSKSIYYKVMSLLDNYYNLWNDLDIFEKEAMFHIELMRIHPFENGNKRTSKIITNFNLCSQDQAPVVIRANETKAYYDFINKRDYKGFARMLEEKSNEELENMVALYKVFYDIPVYGRKNIRKK